MLLGALEVATVIAHYRVQQMQEPKTVGAVFAKAKAADLTFSEHFLRPNLCVRPDCALPKRPFEQYFPQQNGP